MSHVTGGPNGQKCHEVRADWSVATQSSLATGFSPCNISKPVQDNLESGIQVISIHHQCTHGTMHGLHKQVVMCDNVNRTCTLSTSSCHYQCTILVGCVFVCTCTEDMDTVCSNDGLLLFDFNEFFGSVCVYVCVCMCVFAFISTLHVVGCISCHIY